MPEPQALRSQCVSDAPDFQLPLQLPDSSYEAGLCVRQVTIYSFLSRSAQRVGRTYQVLAAGLQLTLKKEANHSRDSSSSSSHRKADTRAATPTQILIFISMHAATCLFAHVQAESSLGRVYQSPFYDL